MTLSSFTRVSFGLESVWYFQTHDLVFIFSEHHNNLHIFLLFLVARKHQISVWSSFPPWSRESGAFLVEIEKFIIQRNRAHWINLNLWTRLLLCKKGTGVLG
jgi:hypothetical protein